MDTNNYNRMRQAWRQRFCAMDHGALLQKLPFLRLEDDCLILPYFSVEHRIHLTDGVVEAPWPVSLWDEMNIMTLLWYCKPGAALTGQWASFAQLKNAAPYAPAFQKGNLDTFAATFTGHGDQLAQALTALGGRKLTTGDVGFEIDAFPCIPMRVLFWEGDEEFPAQVNLLFDRSATDFIHVESLVTIASSALLHLADLAGLPVAQGV